MPRGDRRGPAGYGPGTGRGLGFCAGYDTPGFTKPGPGMGHGFRRGYGRGMRRGFNFGFARGGYAPSYREENYSKEDEIRELSEYAKDMKSELDEILNRIEELKEE